MQENKKNLQPILDELLEITEQGLDKETGTFDRSALLTMLHKVTDLPEESDRQWLVDNWKSIVVEKYNVVI